MPKYAKYAKVCKVYKACEANTAKAFCITFSLFSFLVFFPPRRTKRIGTGFEQEVLAFSVNEWKLTPMESLSVNILLMVLPIVKEGCDKPWGALIGGNSIGLVHLFPK